MEQLTLFIIRKEIISVISPHMKSLFTTIAVLVLCTTLSEEMNSGSSAQQVVGRKMATFRLTIFREICKSCSMFFNILFEYMVVLGPKHVSCLKWSFAAKNLV